MLQINDIAHTTVHRDTNTGGAKVHLSWNNISWKLWCVEGDLDGRKYSGVIFILILI